MLELESIEDSYYCLCCIDISNCCSWCSLFETWDTQWTIFFLCWNPQFSQQLLFVFIAYVQMTQIKRTLKKHIGAQQKYFDYASCPWKILQRAFDLSKIVESLWRIVVARSHRLENTWYRGCSYKNIMTICFSYSLVSDKVCVALVTWQNHSDYKIPTCSSFLCLLQHCFSPFSMFCLL